MEKETVSNAIGVMIASMFFKISTERNLELFTGCGWDMLMENKPTGNWQEHIISVHERFNEKLINKKFLSQRLSQTKRCS